MRRSSRVQAATADKRKVKMSTLLAEHTKRVRREIAQADGDDEPEEGEEVDAAADDSDFIASSEEEEGEEEDAEDGEEDEEEEEAIVPRRRVTTRRPAVKRRLSDGSDPDETVRPSATASRVDKVKSIMKHKLPSAPAARVKTETKPKSILKKPKIESAGSSPETKLEMLGRSVADAADPHRRPTKQRADRPVAAASTTGATLGERKAASSLLSSLTKGMGGGGSGGSSGVGNTLTQFFNEILEWNFHDALMRQAQKDFAVVTTANDGSEEGEVEVARVPSKFTSYAHYFSVWKPLALEEVQAQTLNSVFTDHPAGIPVLAASVGSNFLERTCKIRIEVKKVGVPAAQKRLRSQLDSIFANDLVLLTPNRNYLSKAFQIHNSGGGGSDKASEGDTSAADKDDKDGFLGIVLTQRGSREGITITALAHEWRTFEKSKEELYVFKLNNLVTSVREFRALCDCVDYQLLPLLLSGEHRRGSMQLDSLGLNYVRWLRSTFNESQLEAITAAATSEGFTLIKGPPGTGKTTTLKGLLNSLHLREYSRYYNAVLDVARRPDHETNQAWAKIGNEKPHILVTAPSNAAVDNIVGKIMEQGFCDGEGRKYFPKIVRVGRGMSANVRPVGLDDMVDQICGNPYDVLQGKLLALRREIMQVEYDSMGLRNRFREVVAAIDRDPAGILAREAQQFQLEQQQAEERRRAMELPPPTVEAPVSPPSAPPVESPPPTSPVVQLSPPPPPPPSFSSLASPPPPISISPHSPPAYAVSPSSPPAPHSPAGAYNAFGDDDEEAEEEDEAFPATYGPPETSTTYSAAATSKAYNAFFDDDDDEDMNAEEDEPLPTAVAVAEKPQAAEPNRDDKQTEEAVASDHDEEDEAFPPVPSNVPTPETAVASDADETEEDETLPTPPTAEEEPVVQVEKKSAPPEEEPVEPVETERGPPEEEHSVKVGAKEEKPLAIVVDESSPAPPISTAPPLPMSPPPPPPMSPPPPPPMSPPPPPPGSPALSPPPPEMVPSSPGVSTPPPVIQGPIDYGRYLQYRVIAQQLNGCLERLSELRLEENRYNFALRAVSDNGKPNQQLRQSLEVSFLDTAHIVFTTLSSAGVTALDVSAKYDVLVVDEAAQAVELSSIIPMKFGSRQCVLVGDPQQLSATVFSRTSGVSLYERSLFERLETTGHPVHMLRTQYRSHPLISDFPRHYFYDGKLQDADTVKTPAYDRPYHRLGAGAFAPLVFWNLLSSRETTRSVSRLNVGEADMAVNLYLTLKNSCPPDAVAGKVGVITPYSQQMEELRNKFRRALGDRFDTEVEINTVDGFQGREKDIIILSTVRADPRAGVGFLNDIRRMNVALTRAKFACYVIGSEMTLRSSKPWKALMDHAYKTSCIVHVENPKCNLLTLRPMEMPPGGAPFNHGGGRRGGGGGNKQQQQPYHKHQPPPHVHIPAPHHPPPTAPPPQYAAPYQPHGDAMPGRRPSPTGGHPQDPRGPSPTNNQAWRGGRGRGGGRDVRRDPRLNGRGAAARGGRGAAPNVGHGPAAYAPQGGAPQGFAQPPPPQFAAPNGRFGAPPVAMHQGLPHGQFPPGPDQQRYPGPPPRASQAFHGHSPPPPQYQQHAPPPYRGPPAAVAPPPAFHAPGFPPQQQQQQIPPPHFQDAGRGGGGRIRDPRLLRQQGGRGGGRSFGHQS